MLKQPELLSREISDLGIASLDKNLIPQLFSERNLSRYDLSHLSIVYGGRKDFPHTVYDAEELEFTARTFAKNGQDVDIQYASKFGHFVIGRGAYPVNPEMEGNVEDLTEADKERFDILDAIERSGNKKLLKKFQRSLELSYGEQPEAVKDIGKWTPHAGFGYTEKPKTWKGKIKKGLVGAALIATLGAAGIMSAYAHGPVDITPPKLKKSVKIDAYDDDWSGIEPIKKSDGIRTVEGRFQIDDQYLYYYIHYMHGSKIPKETACDFNFDTHHTGGDYAQKDDVGYALQLDNPGKSLSLQSAWLAYGTGQPWMRKVSNQIHPDWNYRMPTDSEVVFEGRLPLHNQTGDVPPLNPFNLDSEGIHIWTGYIGSDFKGISLTESDLQHKDTWGNLIFNPQIMTTASTIQTTETPKTVEKTVTTTTTATPESASAQSILKPEPVSVSRPTSSYLALLGAAALIGIPIGLGLVYVAKKGSKPAEKPQPN